MSDEHKKKIEEKQKSERQEIEKEKEKRREEMKEERKEVKKEYMEEQKAKESRRKKEKQMLPYKSSTGVRVLNLVLGLILIFSPLYIFVNQDLVLNTALLIFAIILVFSGLTRLVNAFYDKNIGGTKRIIRFSFSLVILVIAAVIIIFPDLGQETLLWALAIGIAFQGTGRVFLGLSHEVYPFWLRLTTIVIGLVGVLIAISAFTAFSIASITIGQNNLINLFAIAFFVSGIGRLSLFISGLNQGRKQ